MAFWNVSVDDTMNGASGEVAGMRDEEPMCMQTTVSVSWQAAKNGSHRPEWIEGRPRGCGFSENATADEPAPALAAAPLLDHPVVVGLDAQAGELGVTALALDPLFVERLAAEAGQRVREADGRVDVVRRHVGEPVGLDPAPPPDLVVGGRRDVELVEPDRGRQLGERVDEPVVEPPVAVLAARDALLEAELPAHEAEPGGVALHPGAPVAVAGGQARRPEVRRFDHVVVDRDDPRDLEVAHVSDCRTRSNLREGAPACRKLEHVLV